MIIVHINTQHDTDIMSCIYDGLTADNGHIVMQNPTRQEVEDMLKAHPTMPALFLGHGSSQGLFAPQGGFIIDENNVELLRDREVIGIWCYARRFGEQHNLRGFFTDMFVSNSGEAGWFGFVGHKDEDEDDDDFYLYEDEDDDTCEAEDDDYDYDWSGGMQTYLFEGWREKAEQRIQAMQSRIDEQNVYFCNQINNLIKEEKEPNEWIECLNYDPTIDYVFFNYSHMTYLWGY